MMSQLIMKKEVLDTIAKEIDKKPPLPGMEVKIIAVDGHGGAGKSTIANALAERLGAEIVHTDDFASWDNPINWWPQLIDKVLEPIKSGAKTLSYDLSKWTPDHKREPVVDQPITPRMILEGVSSARKEFRQYLTYAVWVEAPRELCFQRGIERDGEGMRGQWEKWLASEDEYIARDNPMSYADVVVSGAEDSQ
jgi:uridine kinase